MAFFLATRAAYDAYASYVKGAYATSKDIFQLRGALFKFIGQADKIGDRLYSVIWPSLTGINESDEIVDKVAEPLNAHGSAVIDPSPYLKNRPLQELVVNSSNMHPNARIHAEMAEVFQGLSNDGLNDLPETSAQRREIPEDEAQTDESKDTPRSASGSSGPSIGSPRTFATRRAVVRQEAWSTATRI